MPLGSSDPFIVMSSANLERAVETAVGARTIDNGQSCIAAKRFIVDLKIAAGFESRFVAAMGALRADAPPDSPARREELFGPVAVLFRAAGIEEAMRLANDTEFGLGAAAWTNDEAEQERFIRDIEAGMVFINSMVASDPRLPFGGVKRSGYGRELSVFGLREFVNIKTVRVA